MEFHHTRDESIWLPWKLSIFDVCSLWTLNLERPIKSRLLDCIQEIILHLSMSCYGFLGLNAALMTHGNL
jgi:hypothetical protein